MADAFKIARADRYALTGAKSPRPTVGGEFPADAEGLAPLDILIENGRIAALAPASSQRIGEDVPRLALGGAIVLPLFVDAHTHLDKGHIWPRAVNVDGSFMTALATVKADRETHWNAKDVAERMDFALRCAHAHGTGAIRTHIDSIGAQIEISWPVFAETRERWRGKVDLQGSPLFLIDHAFDEAHLAAIERMVDRHGCGILGAVTYAFPRLREGLDILFDVAERKGWELDFHVDETLDPKARSLAEIAQTALDRGFSRRILVGHCCSLGVQPDDEAKRTIELVAEAKLNVVSLPMCNLYLQDRCAGATPRRRGVTALHELKAAGVRTLIASDNTRDPFYAYGDLDMMEVWREGVRILHLDHPIEPWTSAVFSEPAAALGLEKAGILKTGAAADMIVTKARSFTELFARPQADRAILRDGRSVDLSPPDYAELDRLEGLHP